MSSAAQSTEILKMDKVSHWFDQNGTRRIVLSRIDLVARSGELVLLLGPSGSGKTTLLTLAAGLQPPSEGHIRLFGGAIGSYSRRELQEKRRSRMGFIFQDFQLINSLNVYQNIAMVARFCDVPANEIRTRVDRLLAEFDITYLRERYPNRLSQGEKQRVAIARAVVNNAQLIIADEPTACLETRQAMMVISLLYSYCRKQDVCVLVASHDLRLANYASRICRLDEGMLDELDPAEAVRTVDRSQEFKYQESDECSAHDR